MYTPADKGKGLYKTFCKRVFTLIRFQEEPARNLGVFLCKLNPHLTDEYQFLFVIIQKFIVHLKETLSPGNNVLTPVNVKKCVKRNRLCNRINDQQSAYPEPDIPLVLRRRLKPHNYIPQPAVKP